MTTLSSYLPMITHMDAHLGNSYSFIYNEWNYEPLLIWEVDKMNKQQLLELLIDPRPSYRAIAKLKMQLGGSNE